jgi:uncharacterized protein (TIGR03084 family)
MPVSMDALADDLVAESAVLRTLLADLDEAGWRRETPAEGWTIADQVSHLAYFDDVAVQSATDPDAFNAELERLDAEGGVNPDSIAARYRGLSGAEMLHWFDLSRERLVSTFRGLDPSTRVPWFGPAMSAASSLTARIMETWAHGQDVADALGVRREPTERLRHVAHLGVRTLGFSFALHGLVVPTEPVRVSLTSPTGGDPWTWGPAEVVDRVIGPALDFCLVVTQRRHLADTALHVAGPVAMEWMAIAQAFAGRPGEGRRPGQFRARSDNV